MNLLDSPLVEASARAVWTAPLIGEEGAPPHRIIHSLAVRFPHPTEVRRIGIRAAPGFFKCGSHAEPDWITSLRVLRYRGGVWVPCFSAEGLPRPSNGEIIWTQFEPFHAGSVLLEVRRCGIDQWWTPWALAERGLILEGAWAEPSPTVPTVHRRLDVVDVHSTASAPGLSFRRLGGEVRFASAKLEVGFRLERPGITYLALDSTGGGRTQANVIASHMFLGRTLASHSRREWLCLGPRLQLVDEPPRIGMNAFSATGQTQIHADGISYDVALDDLELRFGMRWVVSPDAMTLHVSRVAGRALRCWEAGLWHFPLNSVVAPCSVVGSIIRSGQTGLCSLPALFHVPGQGTLDVGSDAFVMLRQDSDRPVFRTSVDLRLSEEPQIEGDYILPAGEQQATVRFGLFEPTIPLDAETPDEVRHAVERCAVTAITYRPDTGTLANNGNSTHAIICADCWSYVLPRIGGLGRSIDPIVFLTDTLARWLDGGPSYGSGPVAPASDPAASRLLDDEYLMSGVAAIAAMGDVLEAEESVPREWYRRHRDAFINQLHLLKGRDWDGDGLIESRRRTGNAGEGCWSTCWYDVISFGFKDAFSNALLYTALCKLARSLPRLEEKETAALCELWAMQLKQAYREAFFNPNTGWLGGWRSADGKLHDHAFLFVNGAAVRAGLLDEAESARVINRLYDEMERRGAPDYRLGLPGNLWEIPDDDLAGPQQGLFMGFYQNGGLSHSQSRHFLGAMYDVGMREQADRILRDLCASLASGSAFGGSHTGVDWRRWDGAASGYEGLLTDQFGVIGLALERFRRSHRS